MSRAKPVITIDGPSGTGKGTVCQLVAKQLGWHLLDSGALYRVLALAAQKQALALDDEQALANLAAALDVQFEANEAGFPPQVILAAEDVSEAIRTEECGNNASKIAVLQQVRNALLARQRAFCMAPGLVTDGRDMGTVVFPDAELKIYLDASAEERANRRYKQLIEKGIRVTLAQIAEEIEQRDARDRNRAVAPLQAAFDAVIIDTTELSIEDVLTCIMEEVNTRFF